MALRRSCCILFALVVVFLGPTQVHGQETTGGLQGTVKDPSRAVVPQAHVIITGTSLVGAKEIDTDANGYYHFINLPPGSYTAKVEAKGFATLEQTGLIIEIGRLPTVDFELKIGAIGTVVKVTAVTPQIDVSTTHTKTNVTSDVIQNIPLGRSFQSAIQLAPSARNEPLQGNAVQTNGTGGSSPLSMTNGSQFGFSVAGAADSENAYLVEGQETANILGGYSHTNVPVDFIQEIQLKTSGVEAEHGGALGGVVNVVMKKGSDSWHGSVIMLYENDRMDGTANAYARYNPLSSGTITSWGRLDPAYQSYQPKKDGFSDFQPGFTVGGPIKKRRVWIFLGFNPELVHQRRTVDFQTNGGLQHFSRNTQTYYTNARIDAAVTQKLRVYGSWLYGYQRQAGQNLPRADSTTGLYNPSITTPLYAFAHTLGFSAPNHTTNVGADWTLTPRIVATTRFGYFFENYHDGGFPTVGTLYNWRGSGQGAKDINGNYFGPCPLPDPPGCSAGTYNVAPQLVQPSGYFSDAWNQNTTTRNANKHIQFDAALALFVSGKREHNIKFGYQLNRLSNTIYQHWNEPDIRIFPGNTQFYFPAGSTGGTNCQKLVAAYGNQYGYFVSNSSPPTAQVLVGCSGTYGYVTVMDNGAVGAATSFNHAFFVQDSWNLGKGLTVNGGLRIEHEYLPSETAAGGLPAKPIQFGWGEKLAPRVGAAWDPFQDGKMKIFAGYGQFTDMMKLGLSVVAFGGHFWQNCTYALMTPNYTSIKLAFDNSGRYCTGDSTGQANIVGGPLPSSQLIFLENTNFNIPEGVTVGLKPYRQHESVLGIDYQLAKNLAFEGLWDRRRLDHVIEDAGLFDPSGNEIFTVANPGEGQNSVNSTCTAQALPPGVLPCPPNIRPERSYDGIELRLTKAASNNWFGMFSYTWSRLYGNYSGLTSTDSFGRDAPNFDRAFDESYFQYNAYGLSSSGPLATDRPNTFKGYGYYEWGWNKRNTTDFGIFQYFYQGSPVSTYLTVGWSLPAYGGGVFPWAYAPVYPENRGKWVNVTQDLATGNITAGDASSRRTPWYIQTDFSVTQNLKVSESKSLSFSVTIPNLWNQHSITAYSGKIDSGQFAAYLMPNGLPLNGGGFPGLTYSAYEHPYPWKQLLNTGSNTKPIVLSSWYGKPYLYQLARNIRLGLKFTF